MDVTTRLAIRAVISGLRQGAAIEDEHIRSVMEELAKAAELRREVGHSDDEEALLGLASDIGKDANLVA